MNFVPHKKRQRGVAVILVVGALLILSGLVTDFAFNSDVQYRMAISERDHLQAEYLAHSALNFMRLLLAKEKSLKQTIAQLSNGQISVVQPLCKQFPFDTQLLRTFFAVMAAGAPADAEKSGGGANHNGDKNVKGAGNAAPSDSAAGGTGIVTAFDTEKAKNFLAFDGDFSVTCEDESGKFNLNIFANLNPLDPGFGGLNAYDRAKATLYNLLITTDVRKLFKESDDEDDTETLTNIGKVARNIADWVDADDTINETPGAAGDAEINVYRDRESGFKVRSGRMLSLDEAYLIEGVKDPWFAKARSSLTVWGSDKINVCTADAITIEGLVRSYAASNQRIPPLSPQNTDVITAVQQSIATDCAMPSPTVQQITQDVEAVLMNPAAASNHNAAATAPAPAAPPSGGGTAAAGGAFADLISITPENFKLTATGTIPQGSDREIHATIELVISTKENDPKSWPVLYYRAY